MGPNVQSQLPWEVAIVVENQLEAVNHDRNKLYHLNSRHVLLPPDEPLIFWAQCSNQVVPVHQNMNKCILNE